jgi:hypothetical protein
MESNRYQNGKIYKIVDNGYNKCYIGSTIEALSSRMAKHRSGYRNYLSGGNSHYRCNVWDMFDEYDLENCKIELIEEFPCENKMQLLKREGFHIQNTNCVNKRVEGRTKQEYMFEYNAQYRENNKQKLKEHNSEKIVCEICQSCYRRDNRSHHEKSLKHQRAVSQD